MYCKSIEIEISLETRREQKEGRGFIISSTQEVNICQGVRVYGVNRGHLILSNKREQ